GPGEPRTFLTVNAVVADSREEAGRLALPFHLMMASLQAPGPLRMRPLLTVDDALEEPLPIPQPAFDAVTDPWLLGTADEVADQVRALASEFGVDEVMVQPVAGAYAAEQLDRDVHRERTVEELAARLV